MWLWFNVTVPALFYLPMLLGNVFSEQRGVNFGRKLLELPNQRPSKLMYKTSYRSMIKENGNRQQLSWPEGIGFGCMGRGRVWVFGVWKVPRVPYCQEWRLKSLVLPWGASPLCPPPLQVSQNQRSFYSRSPGVRKLLVISNKARKWAHNLPPVTFVLPPLAPNLPRL